MLHVLLALIKSLVTANPPVVTTAYGAVEGVHEFGCDVFHGVPFAAPPVGDLRWAAPVAPQVWATTLPTRVAKSMCPQIDVVKGVSLGHEDCLYLSVYSPPQCTATTPCPTMFWICAYTVAHRMRCHATDCSRQSARSSSPPFSLAPFTRCRRRRRLDPGKQ